MAAARKTLCCLSLAASIAASIVWAGVPGLSDDPLKTDHIFLLDIEDVGGQLFTVGEKGLVLHSVDQGKRWDCIRTPSDKTLTALAFADSKVGVAVGHAATLLRTEDGGRSWNTVSIEDAGHDSLLGVTSLGEQRFIAYGAFGLYLESRDGGVSWQRQMVINDEFDRHISQVVRVDHELLLVGESGTLLRSGDEGETWQELASPYQGSFFGGMETPHGALLVFGMRGHLYRSMNHGENWQKIPLPTQAALQSAKVLPDGRIVLVGNSGFIALSNDDGQTFEVGKSGLGNLAQLVVINDRVLTVGDTGVETLDLPSFASKGQVGSSR